MTISGSSLLSFIIWLVIGGLIFWLLVWFIDWAGIQEPFNKVAKVVVGIIALIFIVNALLSLVGHPLISIR